MAFRLTSTDAAWFRRVGPVFTPGERVAMLKLAMEMLSDRDRQREDTQPPAEQSVADELIDATAAGTVLHIKEGEDGEFTATVPGPSGAALAVFAFQATKTPAGRYVPRGLSWDGLDAAVEPEARTLCVDWKGVSKPEHDTYRSRIVAALGMLDDRIVLRRVEEGELLGDGVQVLVAPDVGHLGKYEIAVWLAGGGVVAEFTFTATAYYEYDSVAGDASLADDASDARVITGWIVNSIWTPPDPGKHAGLALATWSLGQRILGRLKLYDISNVGELVTRRPAFVSGIRLIGPRNVREMQRLLRSHLGIVWEDSEFPSLG